jgi:hypothetical protein
MILDWSSSVAWPIIVLLIALVYKKPIYALLSNIGGIASRAATQPFELSLGEKLKIIFREALDTAQPKTVDEAISIAKDVADKALSIYDVLQEIPLKQHQKGLLTKIAKAGSEGLVWEYGGDPSKSPGRTMGYLLQKGLVFKMENDRYMVHPVVAKFFLENGQDGNASA